MRSKERKMMNISIPINYVSHYSCLENLIRFVAEYYKKDFQLMSLNMWDFKYNDNKKNALEMQDTIGSMLDTSAKIDFEKLDKYHGIKMQQYRLDSPHETIAHIKSEIDNGRPVAIYCNTYWNHWDKKHYKKIERGHYCLAVDVNLENNNLHIRDPQLAPEGTILPFEDYKNGFRDYFTFEITDEVQEYRWEDLLMASIKNIKNESRAVAAFDEIKIFAQDILVNLDLKKETAGYDIMPFYAPIFQTLYDLSNRRKQYGCTLSYLGEKNNISKLNLFGERMMTLGVKWSCLFGFLSKAHFKGNDSKMIQKFSDNLNQLSQDEEALFLDIQKLCLSGNQNKNMKDAVHLEKRAANKIEKHTFIDLKPYVNNKGFGSEYDINCKSEISNGGRYFTNESLPDQDIIVQDDMMFKILMIENRNSDHFDNIECMGQELIIDQNEHNHIMFLGCSELGSHSDTVDIVYIDDSVEQVTLEMTNWGESVNLFGDSIVWVGKCVENIGKEITELPFSAHLFGIKIKLKNRKSIKMIKLPYCPNVHLFSITLGEGI